MILTTMMRLSLLCGGVTLAALAGCCATCSDDHDEATCQEPKGEVSTVNKMCAVEHDDPVNPAIEPAMYKGQKIGFCCKGCVPKWNTMTDAQKDASLAAAMAAAPKK
ncbi:MAG: hypothetical protein ACREJO_13320 [Phycisphaerales bacterium]